MKKIALSVAVLIFVLGIGSWVYIHPFSISSGGDAAANDTAGASSTASGSAKEYANTQYGFTLKVPADYEVQELPASGGGESIVLSNKAGDGIQIIISPFDEDTGGGYTLTKERILQDLPDLQITNEEPTDVGDNYHGLAFLSNNPAFGGSSRAVWFVYKNNLYQVNTYARLDSLLEQIFNTWRFNQN